MSNNKERGTARRVRLPDGSYGIYMGETGRGSGRSPVKRPEDSRNSSQSAGNAPRSNRSGQGGYPPTRYNASPRSKVNSQNTSSPVGTPQNGVPRGNVPGGTRGASRPMSEDERRRRAQAIRARRAAEMKKRAEEANSSLGKKIFTFISDKVYMRRMSISIDVDNIFRGLIVGALVIIFAMLQTTVFARFRLFGAIPDLMLGLVIATAATEGERWGAVTGLASALLIESIGTTGASFLPLLYVPCGYTVGRLNSFYYKDSIAIRAIYSSAAGVIRAVFTSIYIAASYKSAPAGLAFTTIILPEYFSTLILSALPHAATWLSLKAFHKSRAERVD